MEAVEEMNVPTTTIEELINNAKDSDDLEKVAEKMSVTIDKRLSLEKAKSRLLESYNNLVNASDEITRESSKAMSEKKVPLVKMTFFIMDIANPEEAPLFEFNHDCGLGVPRGGTITKWSFMHGNTYEVPYAVYKHLDQCTILRSKTIDDGNGLSHSETYKQKRFNCKIELTEEQILNMQR